MQKPVLAPRVVVLLSIWLNWQLLTTLNWQQFTINPFSDLTSDHFPIQINLDRTLTLPSLFSNFSVYWRIYSQILNDSPSPFGVLNSTEDIESDVLSITDLIKNSIDAAKCHRTPQCYQELPREIRYDDCVKHLMYLESVLRWTVFLQ